MSGRMDRRAFLGATVAGLSTISGVQLALPSSRFVQELARTPRQTAGPFFPDRLPIDRDNDLIVISDRITPAVGQVMHLGGRVFDLRGSLVRNALVEIWQVDSYGSYLHAKGGSGRRDPNFQGYGRFVTGRSGEYRFRTVRPVSYPGRTPHIHVAITVKGQPRFNTQCYVAGEAQNETDVVLGRIRDASQRASVIVDFAPVPDSPIDEVAGTFDIVLGFTPSDG